MKEIYYLNLNSFALTTSVTIINTIIMFILHLSVIEYDELITSATITIINDVIIIHTNLHAYSLNYLHLLQSHYHNFLILLIFLNFFQETFSIIIHANFILYFNVMQVNSQPTFITNVFILTKVIIITINLLKVQYFFFVEVCFFTQKAFSLHQYFWAIPLINLEKEIFSLNFKKKLIKFFFLSVFIFFLLIKNSI